MTKPASACQVQTVTGKINATELGTTLMHEHLFSNQQASYFQMPEGEWARKRALEPVSFENLWWVRYNYKESHDNLIVHDLEVVTAEVSRYAEAGGQTIVELTSKGLARNPEGLVRVAQATGINIIMGTGYYIDKSQPGSGGPPDLTEDQMARAMAEELTAGVGSTGIRAGIIGEIGCSWPLTVNERKVLSAAASVQGETGVAINIHPGRNDEAPLEVRDALASAGADLSRVIISHMDRCGYPLGVRRNLLDSGCVIEYDMFGSEGYYPARLALADGKLPDMPNDVARIREIAELLSFGYGDQITISHDIGTKHKLTRYGGWGYGHILRNVIPLMGVYGISDDEISQFVVENPRRLLSPVHKV